MGVLCLLVWDRGWFLKVKKQIPEYLQNYSLINNKDIFIFINNLFIKWFEDKNLFALSEIFNNKYSSKNNKTSLIIENLIKLLFYILNR